MPTSNVLEKGEHFMCVFLCWLQTPFPTDLYSVVEYASYDDMKNAMKKLDASELNGRRIKLIEDYRGNRRRRYALYRSNYPSSCNHVAQVSIHCPEVFSLPVASLWTWTYLKRVKFLFESQQDNRFSSHAHYLLLMSGQHVKDPFASWMKKI